jgi:hypothetical protein
LIKKAAETTGFTGFLCSSSAVSPIAKNKPDISITKTSNLLEQLLDYLYDDALIENKTADYLRVPEGLFIAQKTLQKFLISQKDIDAALLKEDGNIYVTYSPVNFEDRRTFKGVLIRTEALDEKWQNYAIQENFQRELNRILS